jgi:hypothetical protein
MTFSYDQIHLPPLSNLVFTLSLYMELHDQTQGFGVVFFLLSG